MRKIHISLVLVLVFVLVWALLERKERVKVTKEYNRLASNYHTTVKNNSYMEDKIQSFQEKLDSIVIKRDELSEVNKAKEEYIDSLEIKLKEAVGSVNQLRDKLGKLEELLIGIEYQDASSAQR